MKYFQFPSVKDVSNCSNMSCIIKYVPILNTLNYKGTWYMASVTSPEILGAYQTKYIIINTY